jgi:hypothetical protein
MQNVKCHDGCDIHFEGGPPNFTFYIFNFAFSPIRHLLLGVVFLIFRQFLMGYLKL